MKMSSAAPLLTDDAGELFVGLKHPNGTESLLVLNDVGSAPGPGPGASSPYTPVFVNKSGTIADGAGLVVVDASTVAVDIVLGTAPNPNMPVYVVVSGSGHQVKVNGIPLGNSTTGDEGVALIHDGVQWHVFSKYGW